MVALATHASKVATRERSGITATSLRTVAAVGPGGRFLLLLSLERFISDFLDGLGTLVRLLSLPALLAKIDDVLDYVSQVNRTVRA
jgi:hypothetical protein